MLIFLSGILVRYRILSVAIANAAITWTILIIAPLGLFAVIVCTLAVFIGSAMIGWLGDRALDQLLKLEQDKLRQTQGNPVSIPSPPGFPGDGVSRLPRHRNFPNSKRRELSDR